MKPKRLPHRVYVNAFPKAGTHLAELFVAATTKPVTADPWLIGHYDNGWSTKWIRTSAIKMRMAQWRGGGYFKGHMGYRDDVAQMLYDNQVCMVFVYRDLRDVAVSQAYHVLSNSRDAQGDRLKHPGKPLFQSMDNFDDVLLAVINGVDRFPGLHERWEAFSPWLDVPWVHPVKFEDMRKDPAKVGLGILRYIVKQTGEYYGYDTSMTPDGEKKLVKSMLKLIRKYRPPTYRKGKAGGWREYWTPQIDAAFNQHKAVMV